MASYFDRRLMILALALVSFWTANVAARRVCYSDVGCFNTSLKCNFGMLPQSPTKVNTTFYLYTPENKLNPEVIDYDDDSSIINSRFLASRDTKFIVHGFTSDYRHSKLPEMKDALLSIGDFNVIMVNWKNGASSSAPRGFLGHILEIFKWLKNIIHVRDVNPQGGMLQKLLGYLKARQNTRLVGRQIGILSHKLQELTGASFTRMHLIGHSLGAQAAGFAGEYLSRQYGRITGLDPAGPGYDKFSDLPGCLLERTDAKFVDIIHTSLVYGNEHAVGHQDFYPNGGFMAASCISLDILQSILCNHDRSIDFFIESITSECPWRAFPCSDWLLFEGGYCNKCGEKGCPRMGYYAKPSATGVFMLGTNEEEPFCREDSGQPSVEK